MQLFWESSWSQVKARKKTEAENGGKHCNDLGGQGGGQDRGKGCGGEGGRGTENIKYFEGYCNNCRIWGHRKPDCWK